MKDIINQHKANLLKNGDLHEELIHPEEAKNMANDVCDSEIETKINQFGNIQPEKLGDYQVLAEAIGGAKIHIDSHHRLNPLELHFDDEEELKNGNED